MLASNFEHGPVRRFGSLQSLVVSYTCVTIMCRLFGAQCAYLMSPSVFVVCNLIKVTVAILRDLAEIAITPFLSMTMLRHCLFR